MVVTHLADDVLTIKYEAEKTFHMSKKPVIHALLLVFAGMAALVHLQ